MNGSNHKQKLCDSNTKNFKYIMSRNNTSKNIPWVANAEKYNKTIRYKTLLFLEVRYGITYVQL